MKVRFHEYAVISCFESASDEFKSYSTAILVLNESDNLEELSSTADTDNGRFITIYRKTGREIGADTNES